MRLESFRAPGLTRFAALALVGCLSGCISLLPKERPVQLYRFSLPSAAPTTVLAAQAATPFTVRAALGSFDRPSAGDRLLTIEGDRSAYIASARWVTSAQSLFEGALIDRFLAAPGPARLLDRGELTPADYRLDLTVRRFEVHYEAGRRAPPVVEVTLNAALDSNRGPASRQEETFDVKTAAAADSITAIVAAYGTSVEAVLAKLKTWVDAKGVS